MKITLAPCLSQIKTSRASVIPYIIINNNIHYLLGIDRKSNDITDIGGGVKRHEYSLSGAKRELNEETIGLLYNNLDDPLILHKSIAIYDDKFKLSSIFLPVGLEVYDKIVEDFQLRINKSDKKMNNEMSQLLWIDNDQMNHLLFEKGSIDNLSMWKRIRLFYSKAIDTNFVDLLKIIY